MGFGESSAIETVGSGPTRPREAVGRSLALADTVSLYGISTDAAPQITERDAQSGRVRSADPTVV